MSHSSLSQQSITNPQGTSNVSPLHQSGSTTMNRSSGLFVIDQRLYRLYERLRTCNPSVLVMVNALNIALEPEGPMIKTCEQLEMFLEAIAEFEKEECMS